MRSDVRFDAFRTASTNGSRTAALSFISVKRASSSGVRLFSPARFCSEVDSARRPARPFLPDQDVRRGVRSVFLCIETRVYQWGEPWWEGSAVITIMEGTTDSALASPHPQWLSLQGQRGERLRGTTECLFCNPWSLLYRHLLSQGTIQACAEISFADILLPRAGLLCVA